MMAFSFKTGLQMLAVAAFVGAAVELRNSWALIEYVYGDYSDNLERAVVFAPTAMLVLLGGLALVLSLRVRSSERRNP